MKRELNYQSTKRRRVKIDDSQLITIENGIVYIPQFVDCWMTQHQIANLFKCFVGKVGSNIRAILKTGVLEERIVCRTYHFQNGNFVEQYNLEMITDLSFRIKSKNAEVFREFLMRIINEVDIPVILTIPIQNVMLN